MREALKFSWDSYKANAWGRDEVLCCVVGGKPKNEDCCSAQLKPVTKRYQDWLHLGLTIVDALDTLYVAGFYVSALPCCLDVLGES